MCTRPSPNRSGPITCGVPRGSRANSDNYTWICLLLPFIEQRALSDQINFNIPAFGINGTTPQVFQNGLTIREIVLDEFLCPSDSKFKPLPQLDLRSGAILPMREVPDTTQHRRGVGDQRLQGVFSLIDPVGIQDIKDGTSNVIAVGEVTNRGFCCGQQWKGGSGQGRIGTTDQCSAPCWFHLPPG